RGRQDILTTITPYSPLLRSGVLTAPPYLPSSLRLERGARDIGRDFLEGVGCNLRCIWNAEGSDISYRDIHGGNTWLNEDRNYLRTSVAAAVEVATRNCFIHADDRFAEVSFGISALCHICNIRQTPSEAPRICEPVSHRRARSILGPLGRGAHRGCATGSWRWPWRGRGHASQSHKRGHLYRPPSGVRNVSRNHPLRAPALRPRRGRTPGWC